MFERGAAEPPLNVDLLAADITHLAAVISESLDPAVVGDELNDLRSSLVLPLPDKHLIRLALLADCLRIVAGTMAVDGQISDGEVEASSGVLALVSREYGRSMARYAPLVPPGDRFDRGLDHEVARAFIATYIDDAEPGGYRHVASDWLGLELCRHTALAGDPDALDTYERMTLRLFDGIARIDGLTPAEERARAELQERLAAMTRVEVVPGADRRDVAFLASAVRVFAPVVHAHLMNQRDPLDVASVHAEVRDAFASIVDRATAETGHDHGRLLLVLGESGSGKTHLLRALRGSLHGSRQGYAAYIQLHSRSRDYARYVASSLIDALDQPYDLPDDEGSGLLQLSTSLADLLGDVEGVAELRAEDYSGSDEELAELVTGLVDEALDVPALASFDPDFLRALLYQQRRDPKITARVLRYLRCQDMNPLDRRYLGHIVPRTDADDPLRMIRDLGRLAWVVQGNALVLLLDQVEDQSYGEAGNLSFLAAADTLRRITDEVPSAIGVMACLDDVYQAVKPQLQAPARDRLERDPPLLRLRYARSFDEIEAIVARRLAFLYEQSGAPFKPDDALYPIPAGALKRLDNSRLRDVLDYCHRFQEVCMARGRILTDAEAGVDPVTVTGGGGGGGDGARFDDLDLAWSDERAGAGDLPEDDLSLIELLEAAIGFAGRELAPDLAIDLRLDGDRLAATINGEQLLIGVANKQPQGGGFARQVEAIRQAAGDRIPVVARMSEFPAGPRSNEVISELRRARGRREVVWPSDLRAIMALQALAARHNPNELGPWLQSRCPISSLSSITALLDLGSRPEASREQASLAAGRRGEGATVGRGTGSAEPHARAEATSGGEPGRESSEQAGTGRLGVAEAGQSLGHGAAGSRTGAGEGAAATGERLPPPGDGALDLGRVDSLGAEPCSLPVDLLCRHAAILGAPGSGKTTAALGLIEQLLERDIPAVLVDRKGDLAGYARPEWWDAPGATPEATARKRALRERVDVRLFTPGTAGGRPLGLPAVPDLNGVPGHERSTLIKHASAALADLGGLPERATVRSILLVAVRLLAEAGRRADLSQLVELIDSRDADLVAEVPRFDDRDFTKLVRHLESVRINNDDLFEAGAGELSAAALLGRDASGRVPLTIVSTQFLGDRFRLQLWVARLLGELFRFAARSPASSLQAVALFDEADVYLPAGMQNPVTKDPMLNLLKRARSGGLGVILATQSPGDFDYRTRDYVTTWLVGKVGDQRSINKMRPLFEHQSAHIGSKLGQLGAGRFYLMTEGGVRAVRVNRSLLDTEQLATPDILQLAARLRT